MGGALHLLGPPPHFRRIRRDGGALLRHALGVPLGAGGVGADGGVVAQEVHKLADSCAETASNIQEVSGVVTGAVEYLAGSARELADYLAYRLANTSICFCSSPTIS